MKKLVGALTLALVACGDVAVQTPGGGDDTVAPDAPVSSAFSLSISNPKVPVLQGTSETVTVVVTRVAPFAGPVTVMLGGLPAGATAAPVTIAAGETSADITISAAEAAPHSLPTDTIAVGTADGEQATTHFTVTVTGHPGALDTSFAGGKVIQPMGVGDDYAYALAVQPDGKVLVAGTIGEHAGDFAVLRLDRDGALDPTFGTGGKVFTDFAGSTDTAYAIAVQPDGKIVAAGTSIVSGSGLDFAVVRYLPNGALDTSFSGDGKLTTALGTDIDIARAIAIQPDGKIVVGGESNRGISGTYTDFALVRYSTDGGVDTSFGGGAVITPMKASSGRDAIYGLALQTIDNEARIVAVGGDGDFLVARYRADGALDTTFASSGKIVGVYGSVIGAARAVTVGPSGALYVAGHTNEDFAMIKLGTDGALDAAFGKVVTQVSTTKDDEANAVVIDGDRLLTAGWASEPDSSSKNFAIARYDMAGRLDSTFASAGVAVTRMAEGTKSDQGMAMALQVDERVPTVRAIVAGYANGSNNDFAVARYWR